MRHVVRIGMVLLLAGTACGLVSPGARAQDLPARKPGLWVITMTMSAASPHPHQMKYCIDASTDAAMYRMAMTTGHGMCGQPDIHRSGNVVLISAECRVGETQMTSRTTMTFTGDTAYHTETQTHFNPPMGGRGDATTSQDAKWAGPCPSDMQPGDMVAPNGMKFNMNAMHGG